MTATQDAPSAEPGAEIGKARRRKEDQRLITGRTRWTDNIQLPGMLHMAMVRSPFAHARITNVDTTEAKNAENVVAVRPPGMKRATTMRYVPRSMSCRSERIE